VRISRPTRLAGPLAVAALVLLGPAVAEPSTAAAPSKDAAVSSTGKVLLPSQANALVRTAQRRGTNSYAGTLGQRSTVAPFSVIGSDDRSQVSPTTGSPARSTVLITRNGNLHCTGWMISADTLLTAGHCVYTGGSGGSWYTGLEFTPASDGGTAPYGTCQPAALWSLNGWVNDANTQYDAGIVKLDCTLGDTVGWYGMWWQTASLNNLSTTVLGYPGDKPATLWQSVDFVRATTTENIFYQNDSVGGMSGSPVYQFRGSGASYCTGQCAMAIHTNGVYGTGLTATNNSGTRITQTKFNTFIGIVNTP
jgi:glutamyl endopeptidase